MSTRLQRVEELLRRAIADVLVRGEIRDPRVRSTAMSLSLTGVRVSPDLGSARVFVDVLSPDVDRAEVLAGLNAAAPVVRARLSGRIRLKRTPSLRFELDDSIERAHAIERTLAEIRAESPPPTAADSDSDSDAGSDSDSESDHRGSEG
jgi:ribosome-binding factor A